MKNPSETTKKKTILKLTLVIFIAISNTIVIGRHNDRYILRIIQRIVSERVHQTAAAHLQWWPERYVTLLQRLGLHQIHPNHQLIFVFFITRAQILQRLARRSDVPLSCIDYRETQNRIGQQKLGNRVDAGNSLHAVLGDAQYV